MSTGYISVHEKQPVHKDGYMHFEIYNRNNLVNLKLYEKKLGSENFLFRVICNSGYNPDSNVLDQCQT